MFLLDRSKATVARAELATPDDICNVLIENMDQLYLLAFMLSANHPFAESCLLAPMGERLEELTVFKDWAGVWIRHAIIKQAAFLAFADPAPSGGGRQPWRMEPGSSRVAPIDDITDLPSLERFTFVLCVLEGYSIQNCSTLLKRTTESVLEARTAAMLRLSWDRNADRPASEGDFVRSTAYLLKPRHRRETVGELMPTWSTPTQIYPHDGEYSGSARFAE